MALTYVVYVLCVLTLNGCEEDVIPLKEILMTRSHVLELALREVLSILSKFTEPEDSTKKPSLPGLTALCTNAGAEHAEKRRGFVNIYGSEL